jgi:hypothetical protein
MNHTAELVRIVLCWAFSVVADENSRGKHFPGPRISQFSLGDMLVRTDPTTVVAIAREIQQLQSSGSEDSQLGDLITCIRSSWGSTAVSSRRTGEEDTVLMASRLVVRAMSVQPARHREILETVSRFRYISKACSVLGGRSPASLRDDFEVIAEKFYLRERGLICDVAEYIAVMAKDTNGGRIGRWFAAEVRQK